MDAALLRYHWTVPPAQGVFPLSLSADSRTLQQANGTPFPVMGFASWYVLSLTPTNYQAYIQENLSKGFNALEFKMPGHDPAGNNAPFNGNGDAPFTTTLGGTTWTGSLTYSNIATDAPDFTTPNEPYWAFVDAFIDYCASQGVLCFGFPAYVGFKTTHEGWMDEMVANGATRMQTYGAWIANRYKNRGNIVWMLGGDDGEFTSDQTPVEAGLITGLTGVTGQRSTNYSAEWSGGLSSDQTDFGSYCNLNGVYAYFNMTYTARLGYALSPTRFTYWMEGTYEANGSPGLDIPPMRRFQIWGFFAAIGGYIAGNTNIWPFKSGYTSAFNSDMRVGLGLFNALIKTVPWWRLVPDGLGSIGTLVTAGGGSQDDQTANDMVTAAATPLGDLLMAYIGPGHSGTVTIDMTKLRGTVTARWWDPTTGGYTAIGSYPNTGTQAFTTPGTHSDSFGDWILRLDA